jgi:hypothetical protein
MFQNIYNNSSCEKQKRRMCSTASPQTTILIRIGTVFYLRRNGDIYGSIVQVKPYVYVYFSR